ncbi:MAG: hypothetical protein KF799_03000 [Bdellovibrionales bacterium]|nr:hypothetical protein [Bdellovibrionales bacterium]
MKIVLQTLTVLLFLGAGSAFAEGSKEVEREEKTPDAPIGTVREDCRYCTTGMKDTNFNEPTKEERADTALRHTGLNTGKSTGSGGSEVTQ